MRLGSTSTTRTGRPTKTCSPCCNTPQTCSAQPSGRRDETVSSFAWRELPASITLQIHFHDPTIEKVRLDARALASVPISRAAKAYIDERNSKRNRISNIPFHRLCQSSGARELVFSGLRVVDHQN